MTEKVRLFLVFVKIGVLLVFAVYEKEEVKKE